MTRRALAVVVLALGGCAVTPTAPTGRVDPHRIEGWIASGRMALAIDGEGGSGAFVWNQRDAATTLSIRGPLGAGSLRVVLEGESVAANDGEGRSLDTAATRALLRERLGTELPFAQLRFWMLGLPAPDAPAVVSEGGGTPSRVIEQSGWRIRYEAFTARSGMALPVRFSAIQGGTKLKVVVDDWALSLVPEPAR